MGNSVVRQTLFRGSWWADKCRRDATEDIKTIDQPPKERRERRAVKKKSSDGGDYGLDTILEDDAVGHQIVGSYYTTFYNSPREVWRYFTYDSVYNYVSADGTRYLAVGRNQIQELFKNVTAPETGNDDDGDGDYRSLIVQFIETVRCPSGKLLIMVTTENFSQSFVVEFHALGWFAVVASVVIAKRSVCTESQTTQTLPQLLPLPPARVDNQIDQDDQEDQGDKDDQ